MPKESLQNKPNSSGSFLNLTLLILIVGIAVTSVNIFQLQNLLRESESLRLNAKLERSAVKLPTEFPKCTGAVARRVVWVRGKQLESGYLQHVLAVFRRLGYEVRTEEPTSDWHVLWAHDYPFTDLANQLLHIQTFQKVNHFPGCGFFTNKVSLSTSSLKHIPIAFKLPADKENFLKHATLHPEKMWVQKSNTHRGIQVQKIDSLILDSDGTFVQEYIPNPLLIDGRKFDIGIYTILTSIDPLRVYVYDGDALLRFCMDPYHPFNESNLDSYVVGDDYLPVWKVPSLQKYYETLSLTMKESLNAFLTSEGRDSTKIWTQIREAIASVYLDKEGALVQAAHKFSSTRNFFEMVRFDFVVDDDLNVYLLEANMSPNLSSAHFPQNKLLYEQVIYNLLSLVGLSLASNPWTKPRYSSEFQMEVSDRDIAVFGEECHSERCSKCQASVICELCHHCISSAQKDVLKSAFMEQLNRRSCRRIVPPSWIQENARNFLKEMRDSPTRSSNDILAIWFAGKCLNDVSWCS